MDKRINQYPLYIPDQFLTSENLNAGTKYLEIEERSTRAYLEGNGIVSGLDNPQVVFAGAEIDSIQINAGYGLSPDGYLLETDNYFPLAAPVQLRFATSEGVYNLVVVRSKTDTTKVVRKLLINQEADKEEFIDPVTKALYPEVTMTTVKCLELVVAKPDPKVDKRVFKSISAAMAEVTGLNLSNALFAVIADRNDLAYNKCVAGDCNDKGMNRAIQTRFLLIKNTDFYSSPLNRDIPSLALFQNMARFRSISTSANTADLQTKIKTSFDTGRTAMVAALNTLANTVEPWLVKTKLTDVISVLNNLDISVPNKSVTQYYLGFLWDVQCAYNELVTSFNDFVVRYPVLGTDRYDRLMVLAEMGVTNPVDRYRYYFIRRQEDGEYKNAWNLLKKKYNRLTGILKRFVPASAMLTKFGTSVGGNQTSAIKIVPSKNYTLPMGDRAIPCYYDIVADGANNGLLQSWRSDSNNAKRETVAHYFELAKPQTALAENLLYADFFRIEGHLGLEKFAAFNYLVNLTNTLDLPIQILSLSADNTKWTQVFTGYAEAKTAITQVITELQNTLPAYSAGFRYLDTLKADFHATSYREPESVNTLVNNTKAYIGSVNKYIAEGGNMETGGTYTGWTLANAQKVKTAITNASLLDKVVQASKLVKQYKNEPILSLGDIRGLEYMGGVPKGGTFVLIHDGNNIIADAAVPYYVSIEQIRVIK